MERCEVQHKTLSGLLSMFSNDILIVLEIITEIDLVYMLSIYLCTLWVWGSSHPLPNNSPLHCPLTLNMILLWEDFSLSVCKHENIPQLLSHLQQPVNTLQLWLVEIIVLLHELPYAIRNQQTFFLHITWFSFLEMKIKSYFYKSKVLSIGFPRSIRYFLICHMTAIK